MTTTFDLDQAASDDGWSGSKWLVVAIRSLAIGHFVYEGCAAQPHFDDAYCSYRYARDLIEENGLAFNVGETADAKPEK